MTDEINSVNQDILVAIMLLLAVPLTFCGALLFPAKRDFYLIGILGFVLFGGIGYYVLTHINLSLSSVGIDVMSITLGLLGALLLSCVMRAAIYAAGALTGWIIAQMIVIMGTQLQWFKPPDPATFWIIVIASACLGGFLVSRYHEILLRKSDIIRGFGAGQFILVVGIQLYWLMPAETPFFGESHFWLTILALAVLAGFIVTRYVHIVMRGITSFVGGFFIASGCAYINHKIDHTAEHWLDVFNFFTSSLLSNLSSECNLQCQMYLGYWTCFFVAGTLVQCHGLIIKSSTPSGDENQYSTHLLSESTYPRPSRCFTEVEARHLEDRCETMIKRLKVTQHHYEEEITKLQDLRKEFERTQTEVSNLGVHPVTSETSYQGPQQLHQVVHIIERPPPPPPREGGNFTTTRFPSRTRRFENSSWTSSDRTSPPDVIRMDEIRYLPKIC